MVRWLWPVKGLDGGGHFKGLDGCSWFKKQNCCSQSKRIDGCNRLISYISRKFNNILQYIVI